MKQRGHNIDDAVFDFPYKMRPDGKCENLQPDNRCGVYANRPLLCQLEGTARAMHIPVEALLWHNAEACNHFMDVAGIPKDGQINLERWENELIEGADEKTKEYFLNLRKGKLLARQRQESLPDLSPQARPHPEVPLR
jgi:Fe-S-cluster containining protein